jgi:hypothetical protein
MWPAASLDMAALAAPLPRAWSSSTAAPICRTWNGSGAHAGPRCRPVSTSIR